ncbi:hypothetical protein [Allokutzneria albata]|uniref:hypothetical protein n=1 Tax=Allokutzneria albata TaxID=211114 RepID=UPI0012DD90E5|nr:hypothetical protein [Allokutzneria albata]
MEAPDQRLDQILAVISNDRLDQIPEPLLDRLTQPRPSVFDQVALSVAFYLDDIDGLDEVRTRVAWRAEVNPGALRRDAVAIDMLLAESHSPGKLMLLVGDSCCVIDDETWVLGEKACDQVVAAWLADLASMIREVLESNGR